ncbi:MAG: alkaline phosphatase [Pirellulaceae bacterium]|nr:alkaline phosphatase [Pirellulaceae bacterium]
MRYTHSSFQTSNDQRRYKQILIASVLFGIIGQSTDGIVNCIEAQDAKIQGDDAIAKLQETAIESKFANWGYWGAKPKSYSGWTNHSNRLIPVYTFGGSFQAYMGENSIYRDAERLKALYRREPESTLNPKANYADQTDVYRLQKSAIESGQKKFVFLVIFDGMDWQTTWAAATYAAREAKYSEGRGTGLQFQDYKGTATDFGYVVTSPHDEGLEGNVDLQQLTDESVKNYGGYNVDLGGAFPWSVAADVEYPISRSRAIPHAYTDSSSSAASMTAGVKIFNGSVNVSHTLEKAETIAHWAQREKGMSVGAVTSVPICHATPAAAYAHNVSRDDYQDLTRDLIGLPSISHPDKPLPGLDVLIGSGWGESTGSNKGQGNNFIPGNRYLADEDLAAVQERKIGRYTFATRTASEKGSSVLDKAVAKAIESQSRLLGFFGVGKGHLPFRTANGDFHPVGDVREAEEYTAAELNENPTLVDFTRAAIKVLEQNDRGFWLMVEAGDVDWANHANNIDNSIGAVLSGDAAVSEIFRWVDQKNAWNDTIVIVTADHGHYLNILDPSVLGSSNQ